MLYRPTPHQTALLKKQGDTHTNVSIGNWGGQAHFSFAVADNFSVQMNGAAITKSRALDLTKGKEYQFEGGVGYQKMINDSLHWEIFGLLGNGRMKNHMEEWFLFDRSIYTNLEATVNTRSLQSSFTFIKKFSSVSIGSRLRQVEFTEVESDLKYKNIDYARLLKNNPRHYFIEPSITCRAGTPKIQISVQWVWSTRISKTDLHHYPLSLSLGLHYFIR